ncbi:FMN-binding protein [Clostridium sp. Marseille-P299]|uniref:FMN-binding protein n=1 Tax=Clostridium sp. Marseille-P299 TaxID=1805477 RepID=UPI0008353A4F|nr:FMN-binding protein [Clostridium sp. Marseille-P299]
MRRKKNNYDQIIAGIVLFLLSIGVIAGGEKIRSEVRAANGTSVEIASKNAELYQVTDLYEKKDGSYVVHGVAKGFKSDIVAAITFDHTGEKILDLEIISQDETVDIGSKIETPEFLTEFNEMNAPIKVADLEILSPTGGSNNLVDDSNKSEDKKHNSLEWNSNDSSAEANAFRNLYDAGLLTSAVNGEQLDTAIVDLLPEERASIELEKANLLVSFCEAKVESEYIDAMSVDAISGATVSSKAVATIVNNAYFFLEENIIK